MPEQTQPRPIRPSPMPKPDRLDSWKDIAAYLGREVRTVQGWEKNEGLPVHRHLHSRLGTVFAYTAELDAWLRKRTGSPEPLAILQNEPNPPAPSHSWNAVAVGILLILLAVTGVTFWAMKRSTPTRGTPSSVVVLPFVDMSPGKDQEYFSDGLTEEIIDALSRLPGVRVVARTSAFQFKGKAVDVRQIAKQLGVDAVLEGSVRKAGDEVRITAQLNRASDGFHLWSRTYDRPMKDIFALQREISQVIATQLGAGEVEQGIKTSDLEAYRLYLQGRYAMSEPTEERIKTAIASYQQALTRDPKFALAYAGLADTYSYMGDEGIAPPREVMVQAKSAAQKALAIDGNIAEAHTSLGMVALMFEWDWPSAEKEFRRALQLSPSSAYTHHWMGHYYDAVGRFDEGMAEMRRALALDPLSEMFQFDYGMQLAAVRRWDESLAAFRKGLALNDSNPYTHFGLGYLYAETGRLSESLSELELARPFTEDIPVLMSVTAYAYAKDGQLDQARKLGAKLEELSRKSFVPAFYLGVVSLSIGDKDRALSFLEEAYEERSSGFTFMLPDPIFDGVRSDPRFVKLFQKVGIPAAVWQAR